ncbi:hypothetical protein WN48_01193 [Eufriesea mexicana]|nr:hypothetical protein WN48_01193 [Eufriesea mexicana]
MHGAGRSSGGAISGVRDSLSLRQTPEIRTSDWLCQSSLACKEVHYPRDSSEFPFGDYRAFSSKMQHEVADGKERSRTCDTRRRSNSVSGIHSRKHNALSKRHNRAVQELSVSSKDVSQAPPTVFVSPPRHECRNICPVTRKRNGCIYGTKGVAGLDLWRQREKGKRPLARQAPDLNLDRGVSVHYRPT